MQPGAHRYHVAALLAGAAAACYLLYRICRGQSVLSWAWLQCSSNPASKLSMLPPTVDGVLGAIGNTPLIRIASLSQQTGCEILGKAEFLNPGGSVKDRVALQIVQEALSSGQLASGGLITEGTAGSTGVSLAMVAAAVGCHAFIAMPDDAAIEKAQLLQALGAEVVRVRPVSITHPDHPVNVARRKAAETPGAVFANQFENLANYRAHLQTGEEIWQQCSGHVDAFVSGAGTGGTIAGVSAALKAHDPSVKVVLADPQGSSLYNKVKRGVLYTWHEAEGKRLRNPFDTITEGVGLNRLTANFAAGVVDDAVKVTDKEAVEMASYLLSMQDLSCMFKSTQFSDVTVVIRTVAQDDSSNNSDAANTTSSIATADGPAASKIDVDQAPDKSDGIELADFPGHQIILCQSDYFRAQVHFKNVAESATANKPTLNVTVDNADHVPAVEAIIAGLYGVKRSFVDLQQHQLVHVVKYADMMQLGSVAQEAVQQLVTAAGTQPGLSEDVLDDLRRIAWPESLLPLMPALARSLGSNLEMIWKNEQLSKKLLKLPLPAICTLLSSEQLQVYSEDTVLYTAARYVVAQPDEQQPEACKQLSGLVRAPHLSDFQLTAQAANDDQTAISVMLLHKPMLQKLLSLKRLGPVSASDVERLLPTAPESWQLPAREILPARTDGAKLLWQVPLSKLVTAYNSCRKAKSTVDLFSESSTALVSGIAWRLQLQCKWNEAGQGVTIGVFSAPTWCPSGVIYRGRINIESPGSYAFSGSSRAIATPNGTGRGDYFEYGVMQGPLLDADFFVCLGCIEIRLTVYQVL